MQFDTDQYGHACWPQWSSNTIVCLSVLSAWWGSPPLQTGEDIYSPWMSLPNGSHCTTLTLRMCFRVIWYKCISHQDTVLSIWFRKPGWRCRLELKGYITFFHIGSVTLWNPGKILKLFVTKVQHTENMCRDYSWQFILCSCILLHQKQLSSLL